MPRNNEAIGQVTARRRGARTKWSRGEVAALRLVRTLLLGGSELSLPRHLAFAGSLLRQASITEKQITKQPPVPSLPSGRGFTNCNEVPPFVTHYGN
jgi:hypothetical protein